jgi:transcriptional regulator with XRE-family HTH domain
MPSRHRRLDDAIRAGSRDLRQLVEDGRTAREQAGLTQLELAAALGWAREKVSRLERERLARVGIRDLAEYLAASGLRLRLHAYPDAPPLRDIGQLSVTRRFLTDVSSTWAVKLEVPLPIPGDRRATDLVLASAGARISVEIFTRLRDAQAQFRGALTKWRDSGNARLVVVLAASRTNRALLANLRDLLLEDFPLDTRGTMAALRVGRLPRANGIVLI